MGHSCYYAALGQMVPLPIMQFLLISGIIFTRNWFTTSKNNVSTTCTKKQQRSLNPNKKKRLKHLMCPFKLFSKHSLDWWREQEGLWKMQQSQRPWTQLQRLVKGHSPFCDTVLVKYVSFIPAFSFLSTAEITVRGKVSAGTLQTSIITQPTTGS